MHYCYILKSLISGQYYIGSTHDYNKRLESHNNGDVKSTKHGKPWKLIYREGFETIKEAKFRELQIKKWKSRKAIERLLIKFI